MPQRSPGSWDIQNWSCRESWVLIVPETGSNCGICECLEDNESTPRIRNVGQAVTSSKWHFQWGFFGSFRSFLSFRLFDRISRQLSGCQNVCLIDISIRLCSREKFATLTIWVDSWPVKIFWHISISYDCRSNISRIGSRICRLCGKLKCQQTSTV